MSADQYFSYYKENGFHFSDKVLTKYCLSLYTKPFLILSGISGTGKTKIAQLFQVFSDDTEPKALDERQKVSDKFGYIIMNVTSGILNGDGRGNFKFRDLGAIFEVEDLPHINSRIDDLKKQGVEDNITDPELFIIETDQGDFQAEVYLQRASSPLLRVRLISKRGAVTPYNSQNFLKDNFKEGDTLKLEKIGKRKLRLVSRNDEAVVNVAQKVELEETQEVSNKLFVSVRSNWTDNTELFGHYSVLEEQYNITPLLKFILTARDHPSKPFFVILDEMNLSKVEHYFSDFLSCLESRIVGKDGEIIQEAIKLHNFPSFVNSNDNYFDLIPESVAIPMNLYVTGTVNIDETTYAFSPKVLDRANVIEFNEVSLSAYSQPKQEEVFRLQKFPAFGKAKLATSSNFDAAPDQFKNCVKDLLDILQPYNLHFGYRVINEMALFVMNAIQYVGSSDDVIKNAIDIQIAQKILPKFSGSFGKLDEPLRKLILYMISKGEIEVDDITVDYVVANVKPYDTDFPESLTKLCRLYINAAYNGFASFLE